MKNVKIFNTIMALILMVCLNSCNKKDKDIVRVQDIVPQEIVDYLRNNGMQINEGNDPPNLELAIQVSPYELELSYGPEDGYVKGDIISDYYYRFYDQTRKQEIKYDYYNAVGHDKGDGEGAFIVGSGDRFTIFSEASGVVDNEITYKHVSLISGRVDGNSIKDFQYAFVMKEKSELEDEVLMPVNKGRVWKDGDGISESVSHFRRITEALPDNKTMQSVKR